MTYFQGFVCFGCGTQYRADQDLLLCPACDNLLDARYDLAGVKRDLDRDAFAVRPTGVWRWRELLPILDPAAIVTLGEGWHNNHHYYQSSANQGFYWWEIDISYYIIKSLEKVGLVWDVRTPPRKKLTVNRVSRPKRRRKRRRELVGAR